MKANHVALAAVLTASACFAQGTGVGTPPPGAGTGVGQSPSGAPGVTTQPADLDLPVMKPAYVGAPIEEEPPMPPEIDPPTENPPPTFFGEEIDSESDSIIYVVDISGSMSYNGRLRRAKAEVTRSVQALSDNFDFNIIAYDCSTRTWSGSLKPATDANKSDAQGWLERMRANGSTGTGPATAAALGDRDNMSVVLLTDGSPNCGARGTSGHRQMISRANSQGATVDVFGISASGSYRSFCQGVASDNGGSYNDVP